MSRNRRYSKNAKNRTLDRIIDQEERLFEEDEEQFLTDDEIEEERRETDNGKSNKPYYFPADEKEMYLQSYEYIWFSGSR